ncbi:MAG: response regulator transcription factor, partial [Verrucomicrobiota bacterium]
MLSHLPVKEPKKIRILLADDHSLVRQGFRRILEGQSDMTVVGEASNGRVAVEMASKLLPDVLVMDVTMPELNGIEATRQVLRQLPRTRVVALSMQKDGVYVREMLRAGATGYLLKECTEADLVSAV